ncbi:ATP-binding protein [Halpernia sp. GG3]
MGNLLLNSLKYSPKESNVKVLIDQNTIELSNAAEENSLNHEELFKRYSSSKSQGKWNRVGLRNCKKNS